MAGARKPVCITLMPYGQRQSHLPPGVEPHTVDFDRLWGIALAPLLEELGYEAVRIDQGLGPSVIREMIERLALCDLLVADLTEPHANLFYEVGVRHAARAQGCALIAATWARLPDGNQMLRPIPYPLPSGKVTQREANAICTALKQPLLLHRERRSPCFQLPSFPELEAQRGIAFRAYLKELARFQKRVLETRLISDPDERQRRAEALVKRAMSRELSPPVALELFQLVRDCTSAGWKDQVRFIDGLPGPFRNLPAVREQRRVATARLGEHAQAVAAIERLIQEHGDTAERRAQLGSRWKRRYREALGADGEKATKARAQRFLDWAIDEYEKGMLLDLNDCDCLCSLPRLLRRRARGDDAPRAARIAQTAMLACERRRITNPDDDWLRANLLAVAFDAADPGAARHYLSAIERSPPPDWILDTLLENVEEAFALLPESPSKPELTEVKNRLRAWHAARRGGGRRLSRPRPPEEPLAH